MQEDAASELWRETYKDRVSEAFEPESTYRVDSNLLTEPMNAREDEVSSTVVRKMKPDSDCEPTKELARGGMGIVYRAFQKRLRREIALKMAIPGKDQSKRERAMLVEALATANLEHPNIVPIYDLIETKSGELGLAMKLVGGTTWSKLLNPRTDKEQEAANRCDLQFHLDTLLSLSNAVAFSHSKKVVHNDLKPSNVMIGEFGEIYLMDWGLATDISDSGSSETFVRHKSTLVMPCGTPSYMAPELATGHHKAIGPATDVYLLGGILHEIITGFPPHRGRNFPEIMHSVLSTSPPEFESSVPLPLAIICRKALSRHPSDRQSSVLDFQQEIKDYLKHRESLTISTLATERLRAIESKKNQKHEHLQRVDKYNHFVEVIAGFQQALVLWDENSEAQDGEYRTRLEFGQTALANGDLGLAESQMRQLPASNPEAFKLLSAIQKEKERRDQAQTMQRRVKSTLYGGAALFMCVIAVSFFLIMEQREKAILSSDLATSRLTDIKRLADIKRLSNLKQESEELWPATPRKYVEMESWLQRSQPLIKRMSVHQTYLKELQTKAVKKTSSAWFFKTTEDQWEHDTLIDLIADLKALQSSHIPNMKKRMNFAANVQRLTIENYAQEWADTIVRISKSSRYRDVNLKPILGLVPLGADPESELEEFAHFQTGKIPIRDSKGLLNLANDTAAILVLIPGGEFTMGAIRPDSEQPQGSPNVDPNATSIESPLHKIRLRPFMIGKFEFTQSQWKTIGNANPSAYQPDSKHGGHTTTARHPVEQVRWNEVTRSLSKVELNLPTEAQWEYAARSMSTTVYWGGDRKNSMKNAMNIGDAYAKANGGPGSWRYESWMNDGYLIHAPVGRYRPNRFGLHDTAGNVWEWCSDGYGDYKLPTQKGSGARQVTGVTPQVFRGGGFRSSLVHARSADRYTLYGKEYRAYDVGFRSARDLPESMIVED